MSAPAPLSPGGLLHLQASAGNAAVGRLLRTKGLLTGPEPPGPRPLDSMPAWLRRGVELVRGAIADGTLTANDEQTRHLNQLLRELIRSADEEDDGRSGYVSLAQVVGDLLGGQDVASVVGRADVYVSRAWLARRGIFVVNAALEGNDGSALVPVAGPARPEQPDLPDLPDIRQLFRGPAFTVPPGGLRIVMPRPALGPAGPLALPAPAPRVEDPSAGLGEDARAALIHMLSEGDEQLIGFLMANGPAAPAPLVRVIAFLRRHPGRRRLLMRLLPLAKMDVEPVATTLRLLERLALDITAMPAIAERTLALAQSDPAAAEALFDQLLDTDRPLTLQQVDRALHIYEATRAMAHVKAFVEGTSRGQHAPQPASQSPTSASAPVPFPGAGAGLRISDYPLDRLLAIDGAHVEIRTLIGSENKARPYSTSDVVTQAARLVALGCTGAETRPILLALCDALDTKAKLINATTVCCELAQLPALRAGLPNFIRNHPTVVCQPRLAPVVANLRARPSGVTMDAIAEILAILRPLGPAETQLALLQRIPAVADLPLGRLATRLEETMMLPPGGLGYTIDGYSAEVAQLDQMLSARVANRSMTQAAAESIRVAFGLLPTTLARMRAFIETPGAVFSERSPNNNAAFWLRWFAVHHRGRPAVAMAPVTVTVSGRQVHIDAAIVNHIRDRHTFENFFFNDDDIINRASHSTFFAVGVSDAELVEQIRRVLRDKTVVDALALHPNTWLGVELYPGAVQMVIRRAPGGGFKITQFYFKIAIGLPRIPRAVLRAIRDLCTWR